MCVGESRSRSPYVLFRCSICCTVRSREVRSFLTGIPEVGPLQRMNVVPVCEYLGYIPAPHRSGQGSVQLDHHQLVQHGLGFRSAGDRLQAEVQEKQYEQEKQEEQYEQEEQEERRSR